METLSQENKQSTMRKRLLLFLSCTLMLVGGCSGPLIQRLYFLHGGERIWFSSWLSSAGFPLTLIPLAASYYFRRRSTKTKSSTKTCVYFFTITWRVFAAAAAIGAVTGLSTYLFTYGVSKLPVSTAALITASQLGFTAFFAFLIVKQKFTAFSVNAIVLLTMGAAVLAVGANGDRPAGVSRNEYVAAFVMTLLSALSYGILLPCLELTYIKSTIEKTLTLVLEVQMVMSLFGTVFSTVGMLVNNDFQALSREARAFELGETYYYVVAVLTAVSWQLYFIGAAGAICYGSSLLTGILITVAIPLVEVLAVIFYHEKFKAEKGISLALSLWGFVSYFYGEVKNKKKEDQESHQIHEIDVELRESLPI